MKRAEIDKILNELFFEFNDKATALLDARKVFVNFDSRSSITAHKTAKCLGLMLHVRHYLL